MFFGFIFRKITKESKTQQRASIEITGTLSSIVTFQSNRKQGERCYQYKLSEKLLSRSEKVVW